MSSVPDRIRRLGERYGSRTALVELRYRDGAYRERSVLDYARVDDLVARLVGAFDARGIGAGDRVAVLFANGAELVVSEWACLLTGVLWVGLNARSSAAEIEATVADCRPRLLLAGSEFDDLVAGIPAASGCETLRFDGDGWFEWIDAHPRGAARPAPAADAPVRIRYTSGTSGRPKGAVLSRGAYDASMETVASVIGPLDESDVLAAAAPLTHASGAMWLPHAAVGASALLLDRFEVGPFVDLVCTRGVTSVFVVPTMLIRLLDGLDDARRLASLGTIVYGGAAMPVDRLEDGLARLGQVFVQIYGLTESTWPVCALGRAEHPTGGDAAVRRRRLASVGRPTDVGELRVDAPSGEVGEILVRGRNTMSGYWKSGAGVAADRVVPDLGDGKGLDAEGWMHTGDVGFVDADGYVTIVDRLHDMIVSGGFNVYPREVEDALSSHPAVLEAAVVGRADPQWGARVHAAVVLRDGADATPEELAAHCGRTVAGYKKPRSFEFVSALPKNAAGKVLRRALAGP